MQWYKDYDVFLSLNALASQLWVFILDLYCPGIIVSCVILALSLLFIYTHLIPIAKYSHNRQFWNAVLYWLHDFWLFVCLFWKKGTLMINCNQITKNSGKQWKLILLTLKLWGININAQANVSVSVHLWFPTRLTFFHFYWICMSLGTNTSWTHTRS